MLFENKVGIVTGGGTGIGRSAALGLAREGAAVIIGGRTDETGNAVVEEIKANGGQAVFQATDVAKAVDCKALVDRAVEEFGRLDLAFNNAGGHFDFVRLDKTSIEEADWVMDVNFKGMFYCLKYQSEADVNHRRRRHRQQQFDFRCQSDAQSCPLHWRQACRGRLVPRGRARLCRA